MTHKRMWYEFEPRDMVNITLPHPDIQGPYNEMGLECPWPWDPIQLKGVPLGQYHCPSCAGMVLAGMDHTDYGEKDEYGLSEFDYSYIRWVREDMMKNGATEQEARESTPPLPEERNDR